MRKTISYLFVLGLLLLATKLPFPIRAQAPIENAAGRSARLPTEALKAADQINPEKLKEYLTF
ncbi:MAG: hypothetical protein ACRD63_02130, partial [Pyrinomonadaceae bacterium]